MQTQKKLTSLGNHKYLVALKKLLEDSTINLTKQITQQMQIVKWKTVCVVKLKLLNHYTTYRLGHKSRGTMV